jgi:hypothetical protein
MHFTFRCHWKGFHLRLVRRERLLSPGTSVVVAGCCSLTTGKKQGNMRRLSLHFGWSDCFQFIHSMHGVL